MEITRSNSEQIKQLVTQQQSLNATLSVRSRTGSQAREELRVTKAREEVLKQQWEDMKQTTEAKLQQFIDMLQNKNEVASQSNADKPVKEKDQVNKQEKAQQESDTKDQE